MISEIKFATSFSSFWTSITPLMEECVHNLNTRPRIFEQPVAITSRGNLSALFSEVAFELVSDAIGKAQDVINEFDPKGVKLRSRHRIAALLREQQEDYEFTSDNIKEISQLAKNSLSYCSRFAAPPIEVRPVFKGCGIISECEGDLATSEFLLEIKSVKRKITSLDLRQLLVYLALRHAESLDVYSNVIILNPRLGQATVIQSNQLSVEASGMGLYELLDEIVLYISDLSNALIPVADVPIRGR